MTVYKRKSFNYRSLPLIGKISLWLDKRIILTNLESGLWLDVLSGYNALLQISQIHNRKISKFYSLDFKLNKTLKKYAFHLKETFVDKTLPYKDNKFNNITIVNGLEHLWYPQEILKECFRVLKPRGILQIIVPTWFGKPILEFLAFELKNKQAYIEMNDHKMYYDKKTLWPMLIIAGFKPKFTKLKRIKLFCSLYAMAVKK